MPEESPSLDALSPAEKRILLAKLLQERSQRGSSYPLSVGQRGLWVLQHRDPNNAAYNIAFPSHVRSRIDVPALRRSLNALVQRHACLRTTFGERGGELVQSVREDVPDVLEVVDARSWSESFLQARLESEIRRPIDLEHGPLLRSLLFTRGEDDHVFLAVAHHIVLDFWSLIILLEELGQLYPACRDGREPQWAPAGRPYADFVRWQSDMLAGARGEQLAQYWTGYLAGVPHVLELPTSRARPPVFSHRAEMVPCQLDRELTGRLINLANQERVTLYAVLLAAYQVILWRYSQQRDFVIGTPFVGRTRPGYERTVGYFVNMLPLRADLHGDPSFRALLRRVSAAALDALEHQDYPFPLIVDRLHVARDPSRPPLVQATFTLERSQRQAEAGSGRFLFPDTAAQLNVGGLLGEPYYVEQRTCRHEIEWVVEQSDGAIQGLLSYNADVLEPPLMRRMMAHLQYFLAEAVARPDSPLSQLPWFPDADRAQVVVDWNRTDTAFPAGHTLQGLFEQQARRTPDAPAARQGEQTHSYSQLDAWANRWAHRLQRRGVGRGTLVACCLDRSVEHVAVLLAILKAGGVFAPLDPHSPGARLRAIVTKAEPAVVVARADLLSRLPTDVAARLVSTEELDEGAETDEEAEPPWIERRDDDLAYVIHTSGSTGHPKGVMVEQRAICNTILWRRQCLTMDERDRVLLVLPGFFDAYLCVVFATLTQGAQLIVADPGEELDPTALLQRVVREQVTVLPATPRLIHLLADHPLFEHCRGLRQIQTGGETLPADLPSRIFKQLDVSLVNLYGPTEAAVEATWWECRPDRETPIVAIGRPIANVRTYVLDDDQRPVPVGVAGQLHIAGAGLARGYWNDPEQTAQRFVTDPFGREPGARLYRTGDRCRWLEEGNLQFLGRVDQQVKVRGYRIELEEIELVLSRHPSIAEAAVAVRPNHAGEPQLVAYLVFRDGCDRMAEDALRRDLRRQLPGYMVPTRFEPLDRLPRTAGGKLDRGALPRPQWSQRDRLPHVPPRTPLESYLAETLQRVLRVERVGIRDHFYDLGGTSIQGAMLMASLQAELGVRVETVALFELAEIGELAEYLVKAHPDAVAARFGQESLAPNPSAGSADGRAASACSASGLLVPLQSSGDRPPLFLVHPPGGIVVCYQPLARCLGRDQPLYGIRARGLHGEEDLPESVEAMAAEYVAAVRSVQPTGPYRLGGWSLGGLFAMEMARQLLEAGEAMDVLAFFDTTIPHGAANQEYADVTSRTGLEYGLDITLEQLGELGPDQQLPYLWEHARKLGLIEPGAPEGLVRQILDDLKRLFHAHLTMAERYPVRPYRGRIVLFRPQDAPVVLPADADRGWRRLADCVDVHLVPGQHHTMVKDPHVAVLARKLEAYLRTT